MNQMLEKEQKDRFIFTSPKVNPFLIDYKQYFLLKDPYFRSISEVQTIKKYSMYMYTNQKENKSSYPTTKAQETDLKS